MDYRELKPSPQLAEFVECFWFLTGCHDPDTSSPQPIPPDGCVELVLNLADPFREHHPGRSAHRQPLTLVAGQLDRCLVIEPTGGIDLVGARFHPAGAYPFLRIPLQELTGRTWDLSELSRGFAREARERLAAARSLPKKAAVLEKLLLAYLGADAEPDRTVEAAVVRIQRQRGLFSVDTLSEALGLSARHLERKFLQQVGISPKLFSQIVRFQNVFKALEGQKRKNWAGVAVQCGYYDQAHLIKDFQRFAGQTPGGFSFDHNRLAECFTRKTRWSDSYNTPI